MRSDRNVKENIDRIGTIFAATPEGERKEMPIHQYSYKDDPDGTLHVGPMAQDVEKLSPRRRQEDRRRQAHRHAQGDG